PLLFDFRIFPRERHGGALLWPPVTPAMRRWLQPNKKAGESAPAVPGRGYCPVPELRELNPPGLGDGRPADCGPQIMRPPTGTIASPLGAWWKFGIGFREQPRRFGGQASNPVFHKGAREVAPCPCMSPRRIKSWHFTPLGELFEE